MANIRQHNIEKTETNIDKIHQDQWICKEYQSGLVSVIIPTYNRAHLIGRAIQSVLDQTYQNFEIILVDDGSIDDTEEVVKSFGDKRITYVRHTRNKGGAVARNTGIQAARGEYIAFQDSDDEWLPTKIEKQISIFKSAPKSLGVVYTDMLRVLLEGTTEYWQSPTIKRGMLTNPERAEYQVFRLGLVSALVKRHCFGEVGLFDERFPALQDLELFIRLSMQYDFHHIKEPLVKYYEAEGISSNLKKQVTARTLLVEMHYNEIKKNKRFLSKEYFMIGKRLYFLGNVVEGRKYLMKALAVSPLHRKTLLFLLKITFRKVHTQKYRKRHIEARA
jgi:glycosyltransferase involved in cell wall biosynthesis